MAKRIKTKQALGFSIEQRESRGIATKHPKEMKMTTTKQTAHDAYLERYAAICSQIEALQQLAEDHFGHNPDTLHWGHVGDLGRVKAGLDDVLAIFNSGN